MSTLRIALILAVATSQTTVCVWNSIDEYDSLNGEYTQRSETHDDNPTWGRYTPATCGVAGAYIFAAYYAPDKFHYWTVHTSLDSSDLLLDDYPECGNDWTKFPSDPTGCTLGWQEWADDENYIQLPLTVTDGECPALTCPYIAITNSGITECDKLYTKSNDNNVFIYNGNVSPKYLYFNLYQFKWYFSDTLGMDDCLNDTQITHHYLASLNDKWKDMNIGESFTLKLSNNAVATFTCTSTTKSPTKSPLNAPTKSPLTKKPTEAPIRPGSPTKSPSFPTPGPTESPTDYTEAPTDHPSVEPTIEPTDKPTLEPTGVTAAPTKRGKKEEIMDGDDVLKRWNIMIQSSFFTISGWMLIVCMCLVYVYTRKRCLKQRKNERMMGQGLASGQSSFNSGLQAPSGITGITGSIQLQSSKIKSMFKKKKKMVNDVSSDIAMQVCQQCGKNKHDYEGKVDDSDGYWYCFECWKQFYE